MIQHLAIHINKIENTEVFSAKLKALIQNCIEKQMPVLTINLPDDDSDKIIGIISRISSWDKINSEKIKINVFGKWYGLAWRIVEEIKKMISETKDYDSFFLNFCIAYDGQEEIADACKLLAKQAKLDKISPDNISTKDIKESLYTSAFMPPSKIIITGSNQSLGGFLLWDSKNAQIVFLKKEFEPAETEELL